jgi:hypothetical protein
LVGFAAILLAYGVATWRRVRAPLRVPILTVSVEGSPEAYVLRKHQEGERFPVPAMKAALASFNDGRPTPPTRAVAIEDGDHILMSAYVRTDKEKVTAELESFLRGVWGQHVTSGSPER